MAEIFDRPTERTVDPTGDASVKSGKSRLIPILIVVGLILTVAFLVLRPRSNQTAPDAGGARTQTTGGGLTPNAAGQSSGR